MKTALAAALCLLARSALAADAPKSAPMDAQAMTKAWQAFASPNENHERLAALAGEWTTKTSFWAGGGAPQTSEGTATLTMVLGGRYLEERQIGALMGQPFEGLAYTGFDNLKKRYVTVWMDNFGTAILTMIGKADESGKVIRSEGTMDEVLTKKPQRLKDTFTIVDRDHLKYELWTVDAHGKAAKTMEIDYTRKK